VPRAETAEGTAARPPRKRRTTPASGRSSGGGSLKAGDQLVCKVLNAEPSGYAVTIPKLGLRAFLATESELKLGEEVFAQYVCVSNGRILLQKRFGNKN
jgi:hypothetical protein